ncbi:specifically androgen-regulated gene protein isoform X2 [Emydura macquarii macquarii]|uniref:specifically androgen-regulated gene protein isoform X2 n=1 Tax=Emydura macquarii macquarii TaxID=1129001 RepID=UPI00352A4126
MNTPSQTHDLAGVGTTLHLLSEVLTPVICDMPKEDLWLGTAGHGSGSCDSMVSTNSSRSEFSDNSYDFLSVEEKECLMFLEETIDSLDTEADSGVSADETDYAEHSNLPGTWPKRDVVPKNLDNGSPMERFGPRHEVEQKGDQRASLLSSSAPSSGYCSLPRCVNAVSAQTTTKVAVKATDRGDSPTSTAQRTGKSSCKMPMEKGIKDQSYNLPRVSTQMQPSDLESVIIQPPEPFQDPRMVSNLLLPDSLLRNGSEEELLPNDLEAKEKTEVASQRSASENARLPLKEETKRGEKGRERAPSLKRNQEKSASEEASLDSNFKPGPPIAPKPRKLPPYIILKASNNHPVPLNIDPSHKRKVPSPSSPNCKSGTSDSSMDKAKLGHPVPEEQERSRQEALEKLGLLQDKGRESKIHVVRPPTAPKPKEVPVPIPRAGSRDHLNSNGETYVTANEKPVQQRAPSYNAAESAAPGLRQMIKSNSLGRSGTGLSSENPNMDSSLPGKTSVPDQMAPSFIRNNRTRPASLGTGKDFVNLQAPKTDRDELEKSDQRKSFPSQNFKFPRPTCVSVKITPKGATDEHRREALKKLGLLKE